MRTPREFDFRGQWETEPDLPMSVQECPVEAWVDSLASGQTRVREYSPTLHQKLIKDLLSLAPPIRTRPSFPHQSLPSRSFHKSYPYSSEGRQNENHNHRKLTKLITWTTALSNSVKLSHAVWGHPRWTGHGGEV